VNLGVLSALLPPWLLRRALRKLDADANSFFFTFLYSAMRTPANLRMPEGTITERVLVRGSMGRRPGFGVVLTQFGERLTLVLEYAHPLVTDDSATAYGQRFLQELDRLVNA
jgi:hypothetical protein